MLKNWKTTLLGVGTLMTAAGGLISHFSSSGITPADIANISAGIGLLFAKDSSVTGT
ncbi:hypothetical protein; putative signal peptide [Bradyrhizobium sp. ORS 278]|uniref:hypothetical protein n=1 Tax=Bradyrhizobium sp. (strain ORS 278) TaxID=114615 RepID=UPI0001508F59|nr:hypothetical protein [Bradyrhizobium sp. ORS 278]CAL77430.1 hypothetical protein; putative signal peptide [Bradyrhizobium sp. ORS 278]